MDMVLPGFWEEITMVFMELAIHESCILAKLAKQPSMSIVLLWQLARAV